MGREAMKLGVRRTAPRVQTPYKLLSLLLQYPDEQLLAARPDILDAVRELPPSPQREAITHFCAYWTDATPSTLAQAYVETFDLQKRSGLYLSFYLYGDTRQRGMALLRLKRLYRAAGLILDGPELPDYLPVMLEFAAFAPSGYGEAVLGEYRAALALLQASLHELGSPYAHLLDALCVGLAEPTLPQQERVRRLIAEGPPSEQVGLEPFAPPEVMPMRESRS
jgi:nitrate reductase delta subunit